MSILVSLISLSSLSALYICWCHVPTIILHNAAIQGLVDKRHTLHSASIQTYQASGREDSRQPLKYHFRRQRCIKTLRSMEIMENQQVKGRLESAIPELCTDPAARRHCSLTSHVRRHGRCALVFYTSIPELCHLL